MTFPGAETMNGGASGEDIFRRCEGLEVPFVEALTGESGSSEDEDVPLAVGECFEAPFRIASVA